MGLQKQSCPICGATNPIEERTCAICGARLSGQPVSVTLEDPDDHPTGFYNFMLGEDDLMIDRAPVGTVILLTMLAVGVIVGAAVLFGWFRLRDDSARATVTTATVQPMNVTPSFSAPPAGNSAFSTSVPADSVFSTPTSVIIQAPGVTRTLLALPSVTPLPTDTEEPGPCVQTVQEGDTLYAIALRCGYRELSITDMIVEYNNLTCPTCIQPGQVIEVPYPTPTFGPSSLEVPGSEGEPAFVTTTPVSEDAEVSAEERIATLSVAITPTLDPNLQYHTIQKDETLYDLVAIYDIDVKLLSEINPEIDFPQCDFGERFGGPTCAVFFTEGQQVRVPAPTPTPTIPPTASGSETPTPSPTATINVPSAFSPSEGTAFDAASIVTLRWSTTGTLGRDEVYAVHVTNLDTQEQYTGITCDQSYDLPVTWQPAEVGFNDFEWHVTVNTVSPFGSLDDEFALRNAGYMLCNMSYELPIEWDSLSDSGVVRGILLANERYPTRLRHFSWQGRGN